MLLHWTWHLQEYRNPSALCSAGAASTEGLKPRERYIEFDALETTKDDQITTLEVCNNKILIGLQSGQINIYNITDLRCETVLRYRKNQAGVSELQCSCTEIIALYSDQSSCLGHLKPTNVSNHHS